MQYFEHLFRYSDVTKWTLSHRWACDCTSCAMSRNVRSWKWEKKVWRRRVKWFNALSSAWLSYVRRRGVHFSPSPPPPPPPPSPRCHSSPASGQQQRGAHLDQRPSGTQQQVKGEEDLGVNYGVWRRHRLGGGGGGCGRRLSLAVKSEFLWFVTNCEVWV